jgi:opacity protein-like surface antigen
VNWQTALKATLLFAMLFALAPLPARSQSIPAGSEKTLPITLGGGASDFDVDWGNGRMYGITAWTDLAIVYGPSFIHGLSIELEGRYIDWGESSNQPRLKIYSGGGGPVYAWHPESRIHPYGKFLMSFGGLSGFRFPTSPGHPPYTHDTRTDYAAGGGFQIRATRHVWVRADYEYQFWNKLFAGQKTLDPQGFTLGAEYNFRDLHKRHN